ncbi:MAG: CvpA family protein [Crocinitomicaceae bacterium]|mgnify:CR=1 FL=1
MNFLDFLILGLLGYAAWKGFKKGFIIELFTFLALFIGLYAGIHFSDLVSEFLMEKMELEPSSYLPIISFAVVFLGIGAMIYFGGKALEKVIKVVQLSLVNKLLGIFFSVLKMVFIVGAVLLMAESYDEKNDFVSQESKEASFLYYPFQNTVSTCIPAFEESTLFLKNVLLEKEEVEENEPV